MKCSYFSLCLFPSFCILRLVYSQVSSSAPYYPANAVCTEYNIPVQVTAAIANLDGLRWYNNAGLTDFVTDIVGRFTSKPSPLGIPRNQTGNYSIGATFCTPTDFEAYHRDTVILASHGFGYDRSYWNIPYQPSQYNFVQQAVNQGYSVFFYDCLGVGTSSSISGYKNQFSTQLSVLLNLIQKVRTGTYTRDIGRPRSIVLMGHSFGSVLTHGVSSYAPDAVDAIILTGYGLDTAIIDLSLVLEAWNIRIYNKKGQGLSKRDTGSITWVDLYSNINTFFKSPAYDIAAAQFSESHKQPFAIGALLTLSPALSEFPESQFKGAVLLISGEYDFIFCDGYCPGVLQSPANENFSSSKNFEAYIQPGMGHAMNLHQNATGFYGVVLDFLNRSDC